MSSPVHIAARQLQRLIGTPSVPAIIDVRIDEDFDEIPRLVPGARRLSHKDIPAIVDHVGDRPAVVICHKGLKLSEGVAAALRFNNIAAEVLEDGMVGWSQAELPQLQTGNIPKPQDNGHTLWVTRGRPKIDRIACPWLIRRFIDPGAQFLFVTSSTVMDVADRFNATPFDMEEGFWTHRGDRCTFDTMLEEWGLNSEALLRLATIVRGADTNKHELAPESAGLLAASLGLSRIYKDDLQQLEAGMQLYDAFYRWARDAVNEKHDWPVNGKS